MTADRDDATRSAVVDRYLECIFYIDAEGDVVRPGRLATWLGVAPPTVTETIRRLERDGWVVVATDRSIALTNRGRDAASDLVRRHRVLERWLTDVLGFDWVTADVEAERLATAMSDEVVQRLDDAMGHPATCPHGNVIPGRQVGLDSSLTALSDVRSAREVTVRRISEVAEHDGHPLLRRLADAGVSEGQVVSVLGTDADSITIDVSGSSCTLPLSSASFVWVEECVSTQ